MIQSSENLDRQFRELYAQEASQYDAHRFSFKRGQLFQWMEVQTILNLLSPLESKSVLDVASGTGRIALELQRAGARVVGADLTYQMLEAARAKVERTPIDSPVWVNANGRLLPFADHSFDAVISIRFLHLHPPSSWNMFFDEMHRVLKNDGLLLVELFNPLYGGILSLGRQAWQRIHGLPGEQYVWFWQIGKTLGGFSVKSITPFWLPGMGVVGRVESARFRRVGRLCARVPFRWIAGPYLVIAQPEG